MPSHKKETQLEPARNRVIVARLVRFYRMSTANPPDAQALNDIADKLCEIATDDQINAALTRCVFECAFGVRLPEIMQRLPGYEVPEPHAEALKAWGVVMEFVDKWIQSDAAGNYVPDTGCRPGPIPRLAQRVTDTVQRTGGWRIYKTLPDDSYPHQRKRFVEEYEGWQAIEHVPLDRILRPGDAKALLEGKAMERKSLPTRVLEQTTVAPVRKIVASQPLSEPEVQDRRAMLAQQVEKLKRRKA